MRTATRGGVTLIEVLVVGCIIAAAVLFLIMMVAQAREQARLVSCRNNLGQIGKAIAIYDQLHQQIPVVLAPRAIDGGEETRWPSPLRAMLETLQIPDLAAIKDAQTPPTALDGTPPADVPVRGFICTSDPDATSGRFPAPVSYRATTGDSPLGDDGTFAFGRVLRLQAVEEADGLSYTAAYSERLVGDGRANHVGAVELPDRASVVGTCERRVPGRRRRGRLARRRRRLVELVRLAAHALSSWAVAPGAAVVRRRPMARPRSWALRAATCGGLTCYFSMAV